MQGRPRTDTSQGVGRQSGRQGHGEGGSEGCGRTEGSVPASWWLQPFPGRPEGGTTPGSLPLLLDVTTVLGACSQHGPLWAPVPWQEEHSARPQHSPPCSEGQGPAGHLPAQGHSAPWGGTEAWQGCLPSIRVSPAEAAFQKPSVSLFMRILQGPCPVMGQIEKLRHRQGGAGCEPMQNLCLSPPPVPGARGGWALGLSTPGGGAAVAPGPTLPAPSASCL